MHANVLTQRWPSLPIKPVSAIATAPVCRACHVRVCVPVRVCGPLQPELEVQTRLSTPAPILAVQIKRFAAGPYKPKMADHVEFATRLDIQPYMSGLSLW